MSKDRTNEQMYQYRKALEVYACEENFRFNDLLRIASFGEKSIEPEPICLELIQIPQ